MNRQRYKIKPPKGVGVKKKMKKIVFFFEKFVEMKVFL